MITREEFLKALDIVEAYHKQLKLPNSKSIYKPIEEVEIGDFVEAFDMRQQCLKHLTPRKKYEVINTAGDNIYVGKYFTIIDDNRKKRQYKCAGTMFKALINFV